MKILYTGFSARECGDTKRDALRFDMNKPVLEACGVTAEVDRRRVIVGEDLSGYDLVVMCLNQALSFNTRHGVLGSLWAAAQEDVPICMFVNDWQQRSWISHLNTILRHPHYLNKRVGPERLFHTESDENTTAHAEALLRGATKITQAWPDNWTAIVPTFAWGDHTEFSRTLPMRVGQYGCVDFSPFGLESVTPVPGDLIGEPESWLLPSLSPQDKWADKQGLEWPVKYLGSRKLKAERVTEQEVLERVAIYEGTLSPRYTYLMGSGWWRIRYNYTALAGSLIAGDPAEAGCLDKAFSYTPRELEQATVEQRREIAERQKSVMEATYWTRDQSLGYLVTLLQHAASLG